MFTGIVQNLGTVRLKKKEGRKYRFFFEWDAPESNVKRGESIAVDGVCLTVCQSNKKGFGVDVVGATLRSTTLGQLRLGDQVNLERALRSGDSVSGHFVTGHVDARGTIHRIRKIERDWVYEFDFPASLRKFIALKGSVAINGISLTVQKVLRNRMSIAIIPHTYHATTLHKKHKGDCVNIEIDMMARYVLEQLKEKENDTNSGLNEPELVLQGF